MIWKAGDLCLMESVRIGWVLWRNSRSGRPWKKSLGGRSREKSGSRRVIGTLVFFHKMANSHRKRNNIDRIHIGDKFLNGTEEVKVGIVKVVKDLFGDPGGWRASPEGLNFSRLNDMEALSLEVPFTEDEVHGALPDLNGDKAPGLDGFTVALWQFGWDVVKSDILRLFRDFHEHGRFVRSLNSTFMVLN